MKNGILAPSILAADFANLGEDVKKISKAGAKWLHVDIMDGVFVPNISFGAAVGKSIKNYTDCFLDYHLMIVDPSRYINDFVDAGANNITIHYEACNHLHRSIYNIKEHGIMAGVALNPATPIHLLKDIIRDVDIVLLMSVNPGFGGQKFIENTYKKAYDLKDMIEQHSSSAIIEVDGGVNLENAAKLLKNGVDIFVAGSSVFSAENVYKRVQEFNEILEKKLTI